MSYIYLSSKYDRIDEMKAVAMHLTSLGHAVTSQWIWGKEEGLTTYQKAIMDMGDVLRSDTLVGFTNLRGELHTSGNRYVELGIALAARKHILMVGPKGELIFHALPEVMFFETVDQLFLYRGL